jgi:hypothetical protein
VDGRGEAFDAAISRSTAAEIAYSRRLDDCGFSEGKTAEINAALRDVNVDLLRLGEEIVDCTTRACVVSAAARIEERGREAVTLIGRLHDEVGEDAPDCLIGVLDEMRESYSLLVSSAAAIQDGRLRAAARDGTRSSELQAEALNDMASCLSSFGV